ncbi:putative mediator of RNA polymerase II transcription subunit 36b [Heracleum sosnowskyi]|uniref:Mediator of RNA polymerase II transcription subunit 36b n=1 Tax=Heracleum sosnowskyi TaxID=360622 RepID=A0AAD8IKR1_9APIA|nr:putative mediator of RNA polymerase II transcription subunit 36b [Heracleum sosnowskyi]
MNAISKSIATDKLIKFILDNSPRPTNHYTIGITDNEDITKVEYRVWDPLRSKLGAAIHHGVTNIWIKPGSRVLYMGNVCGLTISDLSDLVGLEGLVYVVGLSNDVADMAGKRPNVLTIKTKCDYHYLYRMLVGMVDVMFAEIDHHPEQQFSNEGAFVVNNARYYLRAAGHYMISRQVKAMNSTRRFIFVAHDYGMEFKPIETLRLDVMEGAYALDVGGYRMRE